jgi:hypothetical protein
MRPLSNARVQHILTTALRLPEPCFRLRRWGDLVSGSVISATFRGKGNFQRQEMIRKAFDKALGDDPFRAATGPAVTTTGPSGPPPPAQSRLTAARRVFRDTARRVRPNLDAPLTTP